ncbi:MAG: hypothetical protein PHY47_00720 [Lachnospiraceae bacterium]|nr:hypothetical protein [Lachnospiraceae bacterium]
MAWYHVGGCDCPMGCCDCGFNDLKPKTQRDLLIEALNKAFDDVDRNRKNVSSMEKKLDDEFYKIRNEAYKEADKIIAEANKKATEIIKLAKNESNEIKKVLSKVKTIIKKDKINKRERVYLYRLWEHMDEKEFHEFLSTECKNGIDY